MNFENSFIVAPRWIFTAEPSADAPHGQLLEAHALLIENGKITAIDDKTRLIAKHPTIELISRPEHILIPGLVNAHSHIAMTLMRGIADDLPLHTWLEEHIWPAEAQHADADFVHLGSKLACAEMLLSGTTCVNDMYFFPDAAAKAIDDMGMRATVGMIVIEFPTAWASGPDEYLKKGKQLHAEYQQHPLINMAWAPHAPYTVSDQSFIRIQSLAEEMNCKIHCHVHETEFETSSSETEHGVRPLARLNKSGVVSERLIAVHMTQVTDDEITLCQQQNVSVVHCPESNMKLASGMAPIDKLMKAGINVALGTDGAASNNDLDMLSELRSASLLAKVVSGDATSLPAPAAIQMASYNGAKALGLEAVTGSIKVGKAADLCCIDLSNIATQPVYDPVSSVVYAASRQQVSDVWVAGSIKVKDHTLLNTDLSELTKQANAVRERIVSPSQG